MKPFKNIVMRFFKKTITIIITVGLNISVFAQGIVEQSEELGKVRWYRSYDKALEIASQEDKDVLLLFQEVPGCSTCRNYGHNVLSHPLMVEAIEDLFVPLAIFNNKGGKDKEVLNKYNEPSWNNPVVRIIDPKGKDVVKRIGNDYAAISLYKRMKEALLKKGKVLPEYFKLLEGELAINVNSNLKEKCYKMYCFWTGEKQFGKLNGVLSTKSGFSNRAEVVKVTYDPTLISEELLDVYANENSSYSVKNSNDYRLAKNDLHYYLKHTAYRFIPLTEVQKTKINSALGYRESTKKYLSPKQLKWYNELQHANPQSIDLTSYDFNTAWGLLETK